MERTAFATSILDPDPEVHRRTVSSLHEDLQGLDRGDAFELAWSIGKLAAKIGSQTKRDSAKTLPTASLVAILEQANRVLAGWPGSVLEMVQESLAAGDRNESDIMKGIRRLGLTTFSRPSVSALVRRRLPFARGHRNTVLTGLNVGRCDPKEAASLVGLSTSDFAKLARAGVVVAIGPTGERRRHGTYDSTELEKLRDVLKSRVGTSTIADELGITFHGVEQLVCLGALAPLRHPALETLYDREFVMAASWKRFRGSLEAGTLPGGHARIKLTRALLVASGKQKAWGSVLHLLTTGAIPWRVVPGRTPIVRRIEIQLEDADRISRISFDRSAFPDFPFAELMSGRDVQDLFNLHGRHLARALRSDLRSYVAARKGRIRIASVLSIARDRISSAEILHRWSGGSRRLPCELSERGEGPQRVDRLGWRRDEVEHWFGS